VTRRVVITGAGLLTGLADSPPALHAALCAGRTALRPVAPGDALPAGCRLAAPAPFAPEAYLGERNLRPLDRAGQLLACAAGLALADSGWGPELRQAHEVGLVAGTVFSGARTIAEFDRRAQREGPCYASPMDFANTVINAAAGQTAIWHDLRGVNSTVAAGASSGLRALAHAADLVRAGRAAAVLAGGFEELSLESAHGFARAGLLAGADGDGERPVPFDARRNGIALGEGAALLMLEDAGRAVERGAAPRAEVRGYGVAFDPSLGRSAAGAAAAVARAMEAALHDAGVSADDVDAVSASANGSVVGDRAEALALQAVFGRRGPRPAVTAVKAALGEALGAAGALQVLALTEALRDGTLPGVGGLEEVEADFLRGKVVAHGRRLPLRTALVSSVGVDGDCCALVLTAWAA
jgi:3-oxoacyl-(acyl-carrier-protein) synthase